MRTPKITAILLALLILAPPLGAETPDPPLDKSFDLYGFLRLDAVYDDSGFQNHQYAFWALSEDPRLGPDNQDFLTVYPRVTRLGVRVNPRKIGENTTARGVVEVDFQNGGSESRQALRMRVAKFEISRNAFALSAGQDWDLISPLYPSVHTDGILWNAGNLGDRHPQIRGTWEPTPGFGSLFFGVALGQVGAVDNKDMDGNGFLDGSQSGLPFLQARVGVAPDTKRPLGFGAWGHLAREEIATPVAGEDAFRSWALGFDLRVGVTDGHDITAEGWVGENVCDLRGGIGQGINMVTGREVPSRGGWIQFGGKWMSRWSAWVGASIDDPDDGDVPSLLEAEAAGLSMAAAGRTQNTVFYLSNRFLLADPFTVGLELYRWETRYRGLAEGTGNRVDLYFSYSI